MLVLLEQRRGTVIKQNEVETLSHAGAVERVHIRRMPGGWAVFIYGPEGRDLAPNAQVETARGGSRYWQSLDAVQRWTEALPIGRAPDVTLAW